MPNSRFHGIASILLLVFLIAGCEGDEETPSPSDKGSSTEAPAANKVPRSDPIALTEYGKVKGIAGDGILTFKGIRYGADTATTRFAAPAEPAPWNDVRDATAYGASCPQTPIGSGGGLFNSWQPDPVPPLSEDCLFLNVWTPALADGGKRPVMVLDETPEVVNDARAAQRALIDNSEAYGNRYQR